MAEATFYTTTIPVPCPKCGRKSQKLLRELAVNMITVCNYCPTAIDIGSAEWRTRIDAEVARARASDASKTG